jgi:aerobic carbon-monoxide dehydrogenase medium subunit
MKPAKFDLETAAELGDAFAALDQTDGFAKIIAGGQSLVPMMNLRLAQPDALVDIRALEDLKRVALDNGQLYVGALTTHAMIEDGQIPDATQGMMQRVARQIAYRAVRNRGTIGGSVAHADPAADWPTALLALGASAVVRGPSGEHATALDEFQLGAFTVALEPDEVILGLNIPELSADARWGYYKVCRKPGEFADSIGALVIDPARNFVRLVLGATDGAPLMLPAAAERIASTGADGFDIAAARAAIAEAGASFEEFETQIHGAALSRAVQGAFAQ